MKNRTNDNLYAFSREKPIEFLILLLLYAVGAAGIPSGLFCFVFGRSVAGECLSLFCVKALSVVFPLILLLKINRGDLFKAKFGFKNFAFILPFLLVAINNFPLVSLAAGQGEFKFDFVNFFAYFLACFAIAFFEEIVFRGVLLSVLFERVKNAKFGGFLAIILSSALFGCVHFFNLLSGASLAAVFMQAGYSFLIGCACALCVIKTESIYSAVLVHGVFNAGGMLENYGLFVGKRWDVASVLITAILACTVFFYALVFVVKRTKEDNLKI